MKRIYFINDWYGKLPWYYKGFIYLPVFLLYSLPHKFVENSLPYKASMILLGLLCLAGLIFQIFQAVCKNAFIYRSTNQFEIRLKGVKTQIDSKFISEVSFDEDQSTCR